MLPSTPHRALGYIRVSTDEQAEKGYSLPEQDAKVRTECCRPGFQLLDIISDDFTGKVLDRPGLDRVKELAEAGAFDVLVCVRLDRLARINHLRRQFEQWLEDRGIEVLYVEQRFEKTASGNLQRGIMGEFAEYEYHKIREETMKGRAQKARDTQRMPCGCRIFGLKLITKAEATVLPEYKGRDGELVIVPEDAEIARQIFERCAAGQSLRSLAGWLNATGAKPPVGQRWARSSLHHMLRNTAYVGRPYFGKLECKQTGERTPSGNGVRRKEKVRPRSEWIELSCPAIVTEALFAAVQVKLDSNRENMRGRPSNNWPLKGIVFCGMCQGTRGGPLRCRGHADLRSKKPWRRYICMSKDRSDLGPCGTVEDQPRYSWCNADDLEELARLALRQAAEPGRLARFARRDAERRQKEAGNPEELATQALADLKAVDAEEEKIADLLLAGISREIVQRRLDGVQKKRATLQEQLARARARIGAEDDPDAAAQRADAIADRLRANLEDALADPVRFAELCRLLLTIWIYPDRKPRIETRIPPQAQF